MAGLLFVRYVRCAIVAFVSTRVHKRRNGGKMRAVQMSRFGGPEVFQIVEVPPPRPAAGEVLVKVGVAGVNFAETSMRQNKFMVTPTLPAILGSEVAGTVEAIGPGVTGITPGTRVAAPLFASGVRSGGYSEYIVIKADFAIPLPDDIEFQTAVALLVQGMTALYLTRQIPVKGKTVLVNSAAGGVGYMLVQLAKRGGAKLVIGAASTGEKLAFVASVGADVTVNYSEAGWSDAVRAATGGNGPDVIYEAAGYEVWRASLAMLAPFGHIAVYGSNNIKEFNLGPAELMGLIGKNQSLTGFNSGGFLSPANLRSGLAELFAMVRRGELVAKIGGAYPLEQTGEAHRALEGRRTMGKVVLVP
jgi:NADPH:quinone reductase